MSQAFGRSFHGLTSPVGSTVLAVTSPLLVLHILRSHRGPGLDRDGINDRIVGILDAVEANPAHGVLIGRVAAEGEPDEFGLVRVDVEFDDAIPPILETDAAMKEAVGEPLRSNPGMPAIPIGLGGDGLLAMFASAIGGSPEQFAKDHPWFPFVGLGVDEQSTILLGLDENSLVRPGERFFLVIPDNDANRRLLAGHVRTLVSHVTESRLARKRQYLGYM